MKRHFSALDSRHRLLGLMIGAGCLLPLHAQSAQVALATTPLANSTTTTVQPNLMFILDGSGSMRWNYLPDWVDDNLCKGSASSFTSACKNQPPFQSPDFNGIYYNPAITYLPPVDADGTVRANQGAPWTSVKDDAYGIQASTSTNLITNYPDVEWCTSTTYDDCLRNGNYILPGIVDGKSYTTKHNTYATGTGKIAVGSPAAPTIESRTFGPHYYLITPAEYCDSTTLSNCQLTQSAQFKYAAKLRWCTDDDNAKASTPAAGSCQGLRTGNFKSVRYPGKIYSPGTPGTPATPGHPDLPAVPASVTFTIGLSCTRSETLKLTALKIGGTDYLSRDSVYTTSASDLATHIKGNFNSNFNVTVSGSTVTITAPNSGNLTSWVTFNTSEAGNKGNCTFSTNPTSPRFGGYAPPSPAVDPSPGTPATDAIYPGAFTRVDIVSAADGGSDQYPRGNARSDCTTSSSYCTYAEEMTNFANWWTYYQTRMQTMKTSVSRAFKPIDNRYRVGFIDLWGGNYLPIARFDSGTNGVKAKWYAQLFSVNPNDGTPLRSALSRVGRIYAGKGSDDPVQYSCQQNFTLLTTDGYWNTDNLQTQDRWGTPIYYPTTVNSGSSVRDVNGNAVGNLDGGDTKRPMKEGTVATYNTLADAAKYYYDTDLRAPEFDNCRGALGVDVCKNNVFISNTDNNVKQHMTTFTLGLGVDGTLNYTSDYKTATSGDFYNLTQGIGPRSDWPTPVAETETAVDDLWHAAVNGRGTYFSAKDPTQLTSGLTGALADIGSKIGAGAAAATSTLNPVAGDNFAYVASYTTMKWQGNLEARTIDLTTGAVSESATWSVEDIVGGSCPSPGAVVAKTVGDDTIYQCVTPDATADTCPTTFFQTLEDGSCKVNMSTDKKGTMSALVGVDSDKRTIYIAKDGALTDFTYDNLADTQKDFFSNAAPLNQLSKLSQWSQFDDSQKTTAAGANLVNFLRGQTGFEDRSGNFVNGVDNRLYRYREATMGDAVESQPAYVGKPAFGYTDPGYSAFAAANAARAKTVFIGANDGMLHAFNAENGVERWAYVPSMVIPNMWKLADKNYATMHTNYVNGKPVIADVCPKTPPSTCNADEWKTVLIGGLNGGGRGYYALDITNPAVPKFLWEIDPTTDTDLGNLGYTFGPAVVTKKSDGTWVVLLTSGYNNTGTGDGKGYVFVRNVMTGEKISTISTDAGDTDTPSGLAKLANWAEDPSRNNMSLYVYGGDLLGNLWRFDINANTVMKFAVLKNDAGDTQPITSTPELGLVNYKRVVFVATGKYLETSDLETKQTQSLYAIKDDNETETLTNPRDDDLMVEQTVTSSDSATRTGTSNAVNGDARGWYVDFPDVGERNHIDLKLDSGLLLVATTVPSNTVCSPGGYGWLNYFNYETGSNADNIVSQKYDAPIVGINVYYTPDGKRRVGVVTAAQPTPKPPVGELPETGSSSGFAGKRIIWRELNP